MSSFMSSYNPKQIFISYAHKDVKYLQRLQVHLKQFEQNNMLNFWDDTKITPGENWLAEIKEAIASAKVAILLISADFLASKFISENELPPLLTAAEKKGTLLIPVILSPCFFEYTELAQIESVNPPNKPLSKLTNHEKEEVWARLTKIVYQRLNSIAAHSMPFVNQMGEQTTQPNLVQVGEMLWGQYEVLQIVEMTLHSMVIKGWDVALNRYAAIKLLYPYQDNEDNVIKHLQQNLVREARILADLDHKNIAKVYYSRTDPAALIMRWVEGKTLKEYLNEDTKMPLTKAIILSIGLADALRYIHERNITHGDIRPNNIFLNEREEPILTNFEVARSTKFGTIPLLENGIFVYVGTPTYSAPELFEEPELVGPPADVFSLGVVLYEVLTEHRPYLWGNNPRQYVGNLPQPDKYDIPNPLYELLYQMLHQELSQRPTANQVYEMLRAYIHTINV